MPPTLCKRVETVPSEQSKAGIEYEAANGQSVLKLGMNQLDVMTAGYNWARRIGFQFLMCISHYLHRGRSGTWDTGVCWSTLGVIQKISILEIG